MTLGKSLLHSVSPSLEGVGVINNSPSLLRPQWAGDCCSFAGTRSATPSAPLQTSPRRTSGSRDSGTGAETRTPTCPCPRQQGRLAHLQQGGLGVTGSCHSKQEGLASRLPRLAQGPCFSLHAYCPVGMAALKNNPAQNLGQRGGAESPTLMLPSPLLPSRQFPFAGPGHSHCSVPEHSPVSLACYSWKKGQEMYLFFI